jgi:hypothetical protein
MSDCITGMKFEYQLDRDKVSYLKDLSRMLEAKKLGVPPNQWEIYGKIGSKVDVPDPVDKILNAVDPDTL